ncbi:MAG: hypothetical protein ACRDNL_25100 [Spirillospora sp.]
MTNEFTIEWPDDFDLDEPIIRTKGYFGGLGVRFGGRSHRLTFYDRPRLDQEIGDALGAGEPLFFEENLVVVAEVGRGEILAAVAALARSDFAGLAATRD